MSRTQEPEHVEMHLQARDNIRAVPSGHEAMSEQSDLTAAIPFMQEQLTKQEYRTEEVER